jgi:hypothetical protein
MSNANTYTRIGRDEFEEFLGDFAAYEFVDSGAGENIYKIDLPHHALEVRIFSTIVGDHARNSGDDAIRTVLWHTHFDEPVGGKRKTLRIETWRSNLRPKIEDLVLNWRDHYNGTCPECEAYLDGLKVTKGVLKMRSGAYGDFLGCSNYPNCEYTQPIL